MKRTLQITSNFVACTENGSRQGPNPLYTPVNKRLVPSLACALPVLSPRPAPVVHFAVPWPFRYIEAPHTSAFTAVGVYASPSPAGTSDDDSDSAWYGLLALLVIPLCCLPAGLFLWKRQKEKKADELRSTTLSVDPPEIEPSGSARSGPRPSVEPDNETPSSRSRGASHESPPSSPATSDEAQPRDGLDEYSYPIPPHRPSDAHSSAPPPSPGGTPTPTTPYGTPIRGTPYEAYDGTRTYPPTPPAWDTADDRAAAPAAQSSYAFPATQAARGGYPLPPDDPAARYPRHEGPTHRTRTPSGVCCASAYRRSLFWGSKDSLRL